MSSWEFLPNWYKQFSTQADRWFEAMCVKYGEQYTRQDLSEEELAYLRWCDDLFLEVSSNVWYIAHRKHDEHMRKLANDYQPG